MYVVLVNDLAVRTLILDYTVELPLKINSDHATYETQFGHVERPTHKNTTWDMAKFEVCGHKVCLRSRI